MNQYQYPSIGEALYVDCLDNGLTIYVVPKPEYAKAFAFFAVNYGGMDLNWEENGTQISTPAGVAHYLEHKMFDTPEGNALQILSANGASVNAFTSNDITGYYFSCTQGFEENLRTLLSFVSQPYFTQESVDKEQGIIGQEIRMIEDRPEFQLFANLLGALYVSHPLRLSIPGTVESIAEITADTLYRCHRAFYQPSNMVLTVVGNVSPRQVVDIARRVLPTDLRLPPEHQRGEEEPLTVAEATHQVQMAVSAPNFLAGFKCTPVPGGQAQLRQLLVGDLAGQLLAGESSPLYARMYSQGLINKTFAVEFGLYPGAAFLAAGGESREPETVRHMLLEEALRGEITPQRFERAKKAGYGSRVRALNSFEGVCIELAQSHFHSRDYFSFGQIYPTITLDEVIAFLRENVTEERSALSIVSPISQS